MTILHAWYLRLSPTAAREAESRRTAKLRADVEAAIRMLHSIPGEQAILDFREKCYERDVEEAKAELARMGG